MTETHGVTRTLKPIESLDAYSIMTQVSAAVQIAAPPDAVWERLLDFETYGQWNPLVTRITGTPEVGGRVRATIDQPGLPPLPLRAEITALDRHRRLSWISGVPTTQLLSASHAFELRATDAGHTQFTQREQFGGMGGQLVPRWLARRLTIGFDRMNTALKRRVEADV